MGTRTPLAASFSRTAAATAAASARGAWASPSPSGVGFGSSSPSKPLGVDANAPVGPSGPNPAPFVASTAMTGTVSPGPPHATGSRRLDTTNRSRSHCSDASYAGESTATTAAVDESKGEDDDYDDQNYGGTFRAKIGASAEGNGGESSPSRSRRPFIIAVLIVSTLGVAALVFGAGDAVGPSGPASSLAMGGGHRVHSLMHYSHMHRRINCQPAAVFFFTRFAFKI